MSRSGNRHFRPEPSGRLRGLLDGPRTVAVRATEAAAMSFAGQALLHLLVNTLCRQFGVVEAVRLELPAVPVDPRAFPAPFRFADQLPAQLEALGRAVGGGEVAVEVGTRRRPSRVTVLVGASIAPCSDSDLTIVANGQGWKAYCSTEELSPGEEEGSLVPYGPFLAACWSAGLAFRYFLRAASPVTASASLWGFEHGPWDVLPEPAIPGFELPPSYIIGLGAVGGAFSLALACTPRASGILVGIDPQVTDETGRNRLLSALHDEIGLNKADLAARLFAGTGVRFYRNVTRWPDYVTEPDRNRPPELRETEDRFAFEWVLSCVDRNVHRQNIARYLPRHVFSGSTDGMVAQATYYSMVGACECLGCNHPVPGVDVDRMADELRRLSLEERRARYRAWDLAPSAQAAIEEYVRDPDCGTLGATELRRIGLEGSPEFSVGFVSAAAGVSLAAYYARAAIERVDAAVGGEPERRLIFWGNQELIKSKALRKPSCGLCADAGRRRRFNERWPLRR